MSITYTEIGTNIYNSIKSYIHDRYDLDMYDYIRVEDVYTDIIVVGLVCTGASMVLYAMYTAILLSFGITITPFADINLFVTLTGGCILCILWTLKTLVDIEMGECDWWDKLMMYKIRIR